ncbi:MAG: nitrogenase iron-molybdenum cofactor biosynthesis protein NifN [Campylobacterales bacterium]|nr:nitrogenase iron-molybdenum cofactor biosynthesis protein NifN [Campylobacterales bacterium]
MGATLAFLGVYNCMPLMHGAQGCASFSKVFFTRHFKEPIAIQTTAVRDVTAVMDGGDYSILEAIKNITQKVTPSLIGLFTTGLTETKGDDVKRVAKMSDYPICYVNTPDYEGDIQSGWSTVVSSLIEQLVVPKSVTIDNKIVVIPNVNMQPIEVEKVKEFLESFGFDVFSLPDLSNSLDGYLGEKQGQVSSGGIDVEDIKNLADTNIVVTIGESVKNCSTKLIEKNTKIKHIHVNSLSGLESSDNFVEQLLQLKLTKVNDKIVRWRKRLQDSMLDSHFSIGKAKIGLANDSDLVYSQAKALLEVGAEIEFAVIPTFSKEILELPIKNVIIGDFEDVLKNIQNIDILISNFHGIKIAKDNHIPIVVRGFPCWEIVGNQLKNDLLYEGSCYFLFEVANALINSSHE